MICVNGFAQAAVSGRSVLGSLMAILSLWVAEAKMGVLVDSHLLPNKQSINGDDAACGSICERAQPYHRPASSLGPVPLDEQRDRPG